MSKTDDLNKILSNLQAASADIEACAIVSEDGQTIASSLPQNMDDGRIAAMCTVMLSMAERTAKELQRGELDQLFIKGKNGCVIISHAGTHASLIAIIRKEAKLDLIFIDMSLATAEVATILS